MLPDIHNTHQWCVKPGTSKPNLNPHFSPWIQIHPFCLVSEFFRPESESESSSKSFECWFESDSGFGFTHHRHTPCKIHLLNWMIQSLTEQNQKYQNTNTPSYWSILPYPKQGSFTLHLLGCYHSLLQLHVKQDIPPHFTAAVKL